MISPTHMGRNGTVFLAGLALVAGAPSVIAVPVSLPVTTLKQFVELVKANPGKYNYGSSAAASPPHISGALFINTLGLDMVHIPFGTPAKVIMAVLNGDAHLFIEALGAIGPQVKAGKMRLLAIAAAKRSQFAPDTPTVAEAGFPSVESGTWSGLLAPAGTPAAINKDLVRSLSCAMDSAMALVVSVSAAWMRLCLLPHPN